MNTFRTHGFGWTRARPRLRRRISSRQVVLLKLLGFRYSASRDAYVLRVVGNRFGPVYQERRQPPDL